MCVCVCVCVCFSTDAAAIEKRAAGDQHENAPVRFAARNPEIPDEPGSRHQGQCQDHDTFVIASEGINVCAIVTCRALTQLEHEFNIGNDRITKQHTATKL